MRLTDKAYENGHRMGEYIVGRDGVGGALARGSLAHVRYGRRALRDAYDAGYSDAVAETAQEGMKRWTR